MGNILKILAVIAGICAVLAAFYVMALFSPKPVDLEARQVGAFASEQQLNEMLEKVGEIEKLTEEKIKTGELSEEDVAKLEEGLKIYKEYAERGGLVDNSYHDKFRKLSACVQNFRGKKDYEKLLQLEQKGEKMLASEDKLNALPLYEEIVEKRIALNKQYPDSKYASVSGLAEADAKLKEVQVFPLVKQMEDLLKQYKASFSEQNWAEAERCLNESLEIQERINLMHSNTVYAGFPKIRELEIKKDSLKTIPLNARIQEALDTAKAFEKKGNYIDAAEYYKFAYDAQKDLNDTYPFSRHASADFLHELLTGFESVSSRTLLSEIFAEKKELDHLLRLGGTSAKIIPMAEKILAKCEQFKSEYKNISLLDDEILRSMRYIGYLGKNIGDINKLVLPDLLPIAEDGKTLMLKKELSQTLYVMLMQSNPSRVQGLNRPVESLSYVNAEDFCRRLSWILARPVRLPKPSEFKKAVGDLKNVDLNEISWNADNSGLQSQPCGAKAPNSKGFYDLLGNVAEYASPESPDSKPSVVGGSSQTWPDALSAIPVVDIEISARGERMIGFRFVVLE